MLVVSGVVMSVSHVASRIASTADWRRVQSFLRPGAIHGLRLLALLTEDRDRARTARPHQHCWGLHL